MPASCLRRRSPHEAGRSKSRPGILPALHILAENRSTPHGRDLNLFSPRYTRQVEAVHPNTWTSSLILNSSLLRVVANMSPKTCLCYSSAWLQAVPISKLLPSSAGQGPCGGRCCSRMRRHMASPVFDAVHRTAVHYFSAIDKSCPGGGSAGYTVHDIFGYRRRSRCDADHDDLMLFGCWCKAGTRKW